MSNIQNVNLFVCYEVPGSIKHGAFTIGAQYFSDTEDSNQLKHLTKDPIDKALIERYGLKILNVSADIEDKGADEIAELSSKIRYLQKMMPQDKNTICRLYTDSETFVEFSLYGDRCDEGIEKLVVAGVITKDEGDQLLAAFAEMDCDDDVQPSMAAARSGAAARVLPAPEKPTGTEGQGG